MLFQFSVNYNFNFYLSFIVLFAVSDITGVSDRCTNLIVTIKTDFCLFFFMFEALN